MATSSSHGGVGAGAALLLADERSRRERQMAQELGLEGSAALLLPLVLSLGRLAAHRTKPSDASVSVREEPLA